MTDKSERTQTRASLSGKKLFLRPLTTEDVASSYHWFMQTDPQSLSCYPVPCLSGQQAAEDFKAAGRSNDKQQFMIVRKKDSSPVGQAGFFHLNELNRSAEVSLIIDPEEQQSGLGQEALFLLCRFLFRHRGLNKVYTHVGSFNEGGIELFESSGFKLDGTLRHHHFYQGEFHDELVYSLLLFEFEG